MVESESHGERFLLIFDASKMGSGLSLNEYLKLMEVMLFEKGYRSQFDLRPQNTRLPERICSGIHLRRKVKSRPIPDCKKPMTK